LVMKELMDAGLMGTDMEYPAEGNITNEYMNPASKENESRTRDPRIGDARQEDQKEKKGLLKKIFGKKE
jgi:hypothetical protein